MKRTFLVLTILLFFSNTLLCQGSINILKNDLIPYDFLLTDDSNIRADFEFYNELFVKDGIFSKPINVAYIGWHSPLTYNPAAGICYNTEHGNIIILMKKPTELWDTATYRRVLIHEMIHAYQNQVLTDPSLEHNDNFKRISKMINLKYHYNIQNN